MKITYLSHSRIFSEISLDPGTHCRHDIQLIAGENKSMRYLIRRIDGVRGGMLPINLTIYSKNTVCDAPKLMSNTGGGNAAVDRNVNVP